MFTIILIILTIYLLINRWITDYRIRLHNELDSVYDKMEMTLIRERLIPDADLIRFMKIIKNLVVNKDFLDIQVLLAIQRRTKNSGPVIEKARVDFYQLVESKVKGTGLEPLYQEFDSISDKVIGLSVWKPSFLLKLVYYLAKSIVTGLFNLTFNPVIALCQMIKTAFKNQEVIAGLRLSHFYNRTHIA